MSGNFIRDQEESKWEGRLVKKEEELVREHAPEFNRAPKNAHEWHWIAGYNDALAQWVLDNGDLEDSNGGLWRRVMVLSFRKKTIKFLVRTDDRYKTVFVGIEPGQDPMGGKEQTLPPAQGSQRTAPSEEFPLTCDAPADDYEIRVEHKGYVWEAKTVKNDAGIQLALLPIPQKDDDEFLAFCEKFGIRYLGPGRRGWWSDISAYIRGAQYVLYHDGCPLGIE